MLSGPVFPLLVRMATPQAMGFFVQSSVSIAEIWYIGQLGTAALAGMALVFPLLMLVQMLSGGAIGGAVTGAIARALGGGQIERAQSLLWHVIYIALGLAVVLIAFYVLAGEVVLRALGGEDEVLQQALTYVAILFPCSFVIWLSNMLLGVVRGTGNMQLPALIMILGAAVQVPLSGVLILGFGPVPSLGIAGAAVSILTINSINFCLLLYLHTFGNSPIKFIKARATPRREFFHDILSVGSMAAVSPLFTVSTILVMTGLVGQYGTESLAGYGIAARVEFLVIPLVFGLGVSMNSLVGSSIGAGNYDRAERIGWVGALAAGTLTGTAGILLAIFPEFWITIFSNDPETIAVAASYFRITAPFFGFLGIGLALYFASQGARAVGWPVVATSARFLIAVGGGWLLVTRFNGDIATLFMCISAGMLVYGCGTSAALYFGTWRKGEYQVKR